jgi:hypothetical protein
MKSWDCFDTLIARKFVDPQSIFDEVERRTGIKGFRKKRIKAEANSNGTYLDIYKHLPFDIDPSIEFQVELEQCYGIVENINAVEDGDIIVSDMYLSEEQVCKLLQSCGFTKNVKIYVTNGGKRDGWIWKNLPKIDLHIGDNYIADVESPKKYNIESFHYTEHAFNNREKLIAEIDFELACWSRYIRLQCPYTDEFRKNIWIDQANLNIPVLALATFELPEDRDIAFTYRDSAYWHKIYKAMTNKEGVRLDASRICYYNPTDEFNKYVNDTVGNCLIVDLQGTGESAKAFFGNTKEVLYIAGPSVEPIKFLVPRVSLAIEHHNVTRDGTIIKWNNGPVRDIPDHDINAVEVQECAINLACKTINMFKFSPNIKLLETLVSMMKKNYTHKNVKYKPG